MDDILKKIDQIAFVVDDLEKAKAAMRDIFGAEPYRENEASLTRHKMAFYKFANIELELIEPDERDDTQSKFLKKHGVGVHHIRFDTDDYRKTLQVMEKRGFPVISETDSVRKEGVKIAFFDTEPNLGVYIELINMEEAMNRESTVKKTDQG